MRGQGCVILLALAVLLSAACGGDDESSVPVTLPTAENASYVLRGTPVTLKGGKADEPAAPGSASRNVTSLTDKRASGDLDGDGNDDLAVVLTNSPGGTGTFYYLAAIPSSTNVPTNAVLLGDRIALSQVSVKSGTITVEYLTRPNDAPFTATPSVPASKSFSLSGGELRPN
jgi:hypothetical protein